MIEEIVKKINNGYRLNFDDGVTLYKIEDINLLGSLAGKINYKKNGDKVFYNRNLHLNHTNICENRCKFCSFYRKIGDSDSYTIDTENLPKILKKYQNNIIDEIHIVGGLNPNLNFDYYLNLVHNAKLSVEGVKIKGFTAVEIDYFSKKFSLSIEEVLTSLMNAGLDSMPGGGAEIFSERARNIICPDKISGEKWLEIHKTAHQCGIKTNATMLYGHIETVEERVDHLMKLRDIQDQTGGFQCFIPLSYQPYNNDIGKKYYTTGIEDLRQIAVSRIFLDNFKHIKSYWVMSTPELSQIALSYGANDIDGTIFEEKIGNAAGSQSGKGMGEDQLLHLIRESGKKAVRRDTVYNELAYD
ncbi:MAG: aminofutalosine synthase MqnE [Candidatus Cloacimonadota bacterium]|nr:MAG: aminofutalosine synthase MqnE [Candidatus Cloacimonadota bacterium]PIE81409.1 MAG: aminofutalosine synthase MqnE [Candidatus Delongbacteria bacterium]